MRFPTAHAARALLCAAGALAAFASLAQATAQVPAQVPAQEHHFLWEVSSMTNKVYLFGTIHAGKKEWYPLAREIEEAFDASPVLVVEADISNREAMAKGTESMSYQPPDELSKHVPPADYERFQRLLGRYSLPEREMA